jgi:hypothetical protein
MLRPKQVAEKIVDMLFDDEKYFNGQSVEIWYSEGWSCYIQYIMFYQGCLFKLVSA